MWFKLNTTFTQSLGTLDSLSNSWSITRNLTNFSTSSTTTSVTKNSSYSATFTLNSGCTYSSHSVTMGGAAVTSGVSYSNGTLTVNISKVTGAVVITATATGTSSGGGASGGDTKYTITYQYMCNGTSIKTATTEQVSAGTTKTFSTSNAPAVSGYTVSSVSPTSATINSNTTVTYTYTANSGAGGGIDTSATRLTTYGDTITAPNRLASKAYMANVQNSFARGTTVSYIEFPVAYGSNKVYYTEGDSVTFPVDVWVFDVATNKPIEKLIDSQNFTTSLSTNDNYTCHTIIVPINRTFDYDFYFGYANVPSSGNIALAYGSCAGNYLSGTEFEIGTAITSGQNYGIACSIYGTGSTYVEPDDVDDMNQVVYYNETASSVMAGNCYVASKAQTIPANTEIKIMDIKVKGDKIEGVNVYVVNADTNIIEEMLLDEATQDSVLSTRIGSQVLRLEVNKTYNHPIYFLFNAERTGGNATGMLMKSGVANSLLLTDDERKPAVGDDLTGEAWKSGYNIGFAVYN